MPSLSVYRIPQEVVDQSFTLFVRLLLIQSLSLIIGVIGTAFQYNVKDMFVGMLSVDDATLIASEG